MYHDMSGVDSVGRKVIGLADKVSAGAAKVKGAIQGAGAGAKTAPLHPYVAPVIGSVVGALVFIALTRGGRKRGR